MKYYSWKIVWNSNEGTDVTTMVNSDTARLEPHFASGDLKNPSARIYGYLTKGSINLELVHEWEVEELTIDELLIAAARLDESAFIENNVIKFASFILDQE